jgi:hypothetical protein
MASGYSSFLVLSRELHSAEGLLLNKNVGYPILGGTESHEIVAYNYSKNACVPRSARGNHYEVFDRKQMKQKGLYMMRKFQS